MKNLKYYHLFLFFTLINRITFAQNIEIKADTVKTVGKIFQVGEKSIQLDQVSSNGNGSFLTVSRPVRQSFKAGFTGKLSKIELFFESNLNPSFTLKILNSSENLLASVEGTQALGLNSYTIPNTAAVVAGQEYIMELSSINSIHISNNVYSNGVFSNLVNNVWVPSGSNDILFNTYITLDYGLEIDFKGNILSNGSISQRNIAGPFNGPAQLLKLDNEGNLSLSNHGILAKNTFGQVEIGFPGNNNSSIELRNFGGGTPFIDFSNATSVDFDARFLLSNDDNLNLHGANLHVINGAVSALGFNNTSDGRFKKDFTDIGNPLDKVLKIKGLYYWWKQKEFPERTFTTEKQIGFVAQDLEKILPEVVNTDAAGYKSVDYTKVVPLLVEAIKELNEKVRLLENIQKK